MHESGGDWWSFSYARPDPRLARHVLGYCDYDERTSSFTRRRELPSSATVLIVNLGEPIEVRLEGAAGWATQSDGFFAGLHDSYAVTATAGSQQGVQVNLTPAGAHLLLDRPMHELTRSVVGLEELFGRSGRVLRERLGEAGSPGERFAELDGFLGQRLDGARTVKPSVAWALQELERSHGAVPVGQLVERLGCSPRHLIDCFREQVGVTPKLLARILRFERATALTGRPGSIDWCRVACDCGYYDQSHLIRDFRQFAGVTPGQLQALRLPDGGGVREALVAAAA